MKQNTIFRTAALGVLLAGFATSAFASQTTTVKKFYEAFAAGNPALLDEVLAPEWEDTPMNPGQAPGRDGFKPLVAGWSKTFADTHITNDQIIEAGDMVVVRSTLEFKQVGEFVGLPASGKPVKIMAIDIHQFKDGLIVRTWHVEDWLSGLFQMGAFAH